MRSVTVLPAVLPQALATADVIVPAAVMGVADHGRAEAQLLLIVISEPSPPARSG